MWFARYVDATGQKRQVSCKTSDYKTAMTILKNLESAVALERFGLAEQGSSSLRVKSDETIQGCIETFLDSKEAAGRTPRYIQSMRRELESTIKSTKWKIPSDICEPPLVKHVNQMAKDGLSPRSIQSLLTTWKGFTKWLRRQKMIVSDPLVGLEKPSPERDRRLVRRALSADELGWLVATTLTKNETKNGMTGQERAILYRAAVETGLRSGELRALLVKDLHLKGDAPRVHLEAAATKNGQLASQHISKDLAAELTLLVKDRNAGDRVFNVGDPARMAKALREDLEAARTVWLAEGKKISGREHKRRRKSSFLEAESAEGEIDFHALRHTCATLLAGTGASVRLLQSVLRHSDPSLTIGRYGHLLANEAATVTQKLGDAITKVATIWPPDQEKDPNETAVAKSQKRASRKKKSR